MRLLQHHLRLYFVLVLSFFFSPPHRMISSLSLVKGCENIKAKASVSSLLESYDLAEVSWQAAGSVTGGERGPKF